MKHVDVVIISWARNEELLQITKNGLNSLFESEKDVTFHAYVVESNKDICYEDLEEYQMESIHSVKTIHPKEEFGYHKYLNIGRRAGNSPYVVLCNSDLTYEKNWASNTIKVMEELPRFLSASPWCPQTQGSNESNLENVFEGYRVRGELAGWCIFQQRKIYDIIKELDERFSFWYCDNDYSLELQKHGISHCLVPASVVNHHEKNLGKTGETLSETDQRKITTDQQSVFMDKWRNFIN
jgi:GT2 family glycosyltransferase